MPPQPLNPEVPQEPTGEEAILEYILQTTVQDGQEASIQRDNQLQATAEVTETLKGMEPLLEMSLQVQSDIHKEVKNQRPTTIRIEGEASEFISMKGETGEKGEQGIQGEKGEKGDKGDKGDNGLDGRDGLDGVQGIQGEQGEKGDTGEKGEKGDKGDRGATGPRGLKGDSASAPDVTKFLEELKADTKKDIDSRTEAFRKISSRDYDLVELKDVSIVSPSNNQVLKYNSTTRKWENGTGGGGSGVVETVVGDGSVVVDATDPANPIVSLTGDSDAPGNSKYYGTDSGGTKGFFNLPGGGTGITRSVTVTSGAFTAGSTAATDYVYLIAGAHAVAMPTATGNSDRYTFKNNHSANITITPDGAETIEGAATLSLAPQESIDLISNNTTNWNVI